MTTERAYVVSMDATGQVVNLIDGIRSAADRARKADPGDRSDVVRFEALATELEHLAARAPEAPIEIPMADVEGALLFGTDESTWTNVHGEARVAANAIVEQGRIPVVLVETFGEGRVRLIPSGEGAPPVATRWEADEGVTGRRAVEARFRSQMEEAIEARQQGSEPQAISPSGIQNAVVTEILREFVATSSGEERTDVPVEYRDGSRSQHLFPLRSLELRSDPFLTEERDLHFALLSIRHTEMDAVVHGAWLRNAEVSRPRPAALTDDLVYKLSRTQLQELSRDAIPVRIHMYQTGLETAVLGFYRALADHLLEFPGTVAVQPMYFQNREPAKNYRRTGYQPHAGKDGKSRKQVRHDEVTVKRAPFRKGTPWWT